MSKTKKTGSKNSVLSGVLLFALAYLLLVGAYFALNMYIDKKNNELSVLSVTEERNEFTTSGYDVVITVSKRWVSDELVGAQYDGIVYNKSGNSISGWCLDLDVPEGSWIDSDWNGVFTFSDDGRTLNITPLDYNYTVVAGGNETFGMVMYTTDTFDANSMTFSFYKHNEITQSAAFYIIIALAGITTLVALVMAITESRLRSYRRRQHQYKKIIRETLGAFANVIDAKDEYTNGHSIRVALYSRELARRMGLDDQMQENIYMIALLHDIGKVGIPDAILNKPGKLSPEELEIVRSHTSVGRKILANITSVENIANGAHYHHERFDGTGYPTGLAGESIPLCARIICVADSYDAMSSTRCYREMLSSSEIIDELERCAGTQFDPSIVPHMVSMIKDATVPAVV